MESTTSIIGSAGKMILYPTSKLWGRGRTQILSKAESLHRTFRDGFPVSLEGVMMVYLGSYHPSYRPVIASDAAHDLVDEPRFHDHA